MTSQLSLFPAARERTATPAEIALLDRTLSGAGWLTRRQIAAVLGWTERKVRAVASADARFISFPGSPGYKHIDQCTREEFDHFCDAHRSQARKETERVCRAERLWHSMRAA